MELTNEQVAHVKRIIQDDLPDALERACRSAFGRLWSERSPEMLAAVLTECRSEIRRDHSETVVRFKIVESTAQDAKASAEIAAKNSSSVLAHVLHISDSLAVLGSQFAKWTGMSEGRIVERDTWIDRAKMVGKWVAAVCSGGAGVKGLEWLLAHLHH